MKKLKFIKTLTLAFIFAFSIFGLTPTYAADPCDANLPVSVREANGCPGTGSTDALPNIIINILNAVIGIAGLVAVIFVIIGGFNYMTSAGDPGKTKKAKDTILYAVIGLIICVLAFAIVNFVIKNIINNQFSSESNQSSSKSTSSYTIEETHIFAVLNSKNICQ